MALKLDQLLDDNQAQARQFFQSMIANFAYALKSHLRHQSPEKQFINSDTFGLPDLRLDEHVPQQIALAIFGKIHALQKQGVLIPEHLLLLNAEVQSLMDICGAFGLEKSGS
jgi:putative membrane protein